MRDIEQPLSYWGPEKCKLCRCIITQIYSSGKGWTKECRCSIIEYNENAALENNP